MVQSPEFRSQPQQHPAAAGAMSPGTTPVSRAGERRLLFVCIPMAGHLNPLLQPAKLLMQRPGHAVLLAAHEQMRSAVEAAGIPFASLGPDTAQHSCEHQHMVVDALATRRERMQALSAMYTAWEEGMYAPLLAACEAFSPDVLVADMTTLAAHDAAETLQLPLALLGSMPLSLALDMCGLGVYNAAPSVPFESAGGLVMPQHMGPVTRHVINPLAKAVLGDSSLHYSGMLRARDRLRERVGLPDMPLAAAPLQPSRRIPRTTFMLASSWLMEPRRELPRNFHLVGAMCDFTRNFPPPLEAGGVKAFLDAAADAGRPAVLVATGTSVVLPPALVAEMAAAFASLPHISFVWCLKEASQPHLPPCYAPRAVCVTRWLPSQTAVLGHPAIRGLLAHGGFTTTNEALAVGRPLLVMPFGGDQAVVAQHVKDHGYGLTISPVGLRAEALAAAITALLGERRFAAAAADAGAKTRKCCGPALTAWLLADFARGPPPDCEPEFDNDGEDGSD